MKNDLEEISIEEVNRLGKELSTILLDQIEYSKSMLDKFNNFIEETNSYKLDHIVKYYVNRESGDLTYTKQKKYKPGFVTK